MHSHTPKRRSLRAMSPLTQATSPRNELDQRLESYKKSKPGVVATLDERDNARSEVKTIRDTTVRFQGMTALLIVAITQTTTF